MAGVDGIGGFWLYIFNNIGAAHTVALDYKTVSHCFILPAT